MIYTLRIKTIRPPSDTVRIGRSGRGSRSKKSKMRKQQASIC